MGKLWEEEMYAKEDKQETFCVGSERKGEPF